MEKEVPKKVRPAMQDGTLWSPYRLKDLRTRGFQEIRTLHWCHEGTVADRQQYMRIIDESAKL